jgi:hypothetical protein
VAAGAAAAAGGSNGSATFGVDNGDHFVSNNGAAVALDDLHQVPAAGAGSSRTTLSVSISIRFSSRATVSPTFYARSAWLLLRPIPTAEEL